VGASGSAFFCGRLGGGGMTFQVILHGDALAQGFVVAHN
jgi:hypothetical protein